MGIMSATRSTSKAPSVRRPKKKAMMPLMTMLAACMGAFWPYSVRMSMRRSRNVFSMTCSMSPTVRPASPCSGLTCSHISLHTLGGRVLLSSSRQSSLVASVTCSMTTPWYISTALRALREPVSPSATRDVCSWAVATRVRSPVAAGTRGGGQWASGRGRAGGTRTYR